MQKNLERQELLNHLFQLLYRPRDLIMALDQVLALLGAYTRASHVFLLENTGDGQAAEITLEWHSAANPPRSADVRKIVYARYPSLLKYIEARGLVCVSEGSAPDPDLAWLLTDLHARTFVAIPVYGKNRMHGMIAYDDLLEQQSWDQEDQDLLRSISRAASNAIARHQVEEEEHSQRVLAEVMRDITSVLTTSLSFKEMLEHILVNLERVIPHQAANIALLDAQNNLTIEHARGYPPEILSRIYQVRVQVKDWTTYRRVSAAHDPVLIPDTRQDPGWVILPELDWTRSYIGAAIRARGKTLGILNVDSPIPGFFNEDLASRVQAFADHAAIAIENARLFQEIQRRADQMTTLYQIGLTLTQGLDLEQVLTSLHVQCSQVLPNDVFYVAIYDEKTHVVDHPLYYEAGHYINIPSRNLLVSPGLSGQVILTRKTLFIADTLDPEINAKYQIIRSGGVPARTYIGVPLIAHDQVIGVLSMQRYDPMAYSEDEVRLLETIANQAAVTIENARIFHQMRQMAITDNLTGVFTRWHLMALGQVEVGRAQRYRRQLAVLMMDIDHFKDFNDTYGHNTGDQVIQAVARMCQQGLRSSDVIGRYGGDEFVIILTDTSLEGARATAERIRALVEMVTVSSPVQSMSVTCSIGLADLQPGHASLDDLLICADRALYVAKQSGRNQVRVYEGSLAPIGQAGARVYTQEPAGKK